MEVPNPLLDAAEDRAIARIARQDEGKEHDEDGNPVEWRKSQQNEAEEEAPEEPVSWQPS